jgi:hypothetical protein
MNDRAAPGNAVVKTREAAVRPLLGVAAMVTIAFFLASAHATEPVAAEPGTNPLASLVRSALDEPPLYGRVEQRISAGSYSYLALRTSEGAQRWTVTMGRGQPVGANVSVRSIGYSPRFYSKRLRREFPNLVFGIVSALD